MDPNGGKSKLPSWLVDFLKTASGLDDQQGGNLPSALGAAVAPAGMAMGMAGKTAPAIEELIALMEKMGVKVPGNLQGATAPLPSMPTAGTLGQGPNGLVGVGAAKLRVPGQ